MKNNSDLIAVAIVALVGAIGPRHASWLEPGINLAASRWAEMPCAQEPVRALLAVFGG